MTGKRSITEGQLDRLVDGELSNDERRAVLESLENEADGWRRCAIAFLESQAWQAALSETATPTTPARPAPRKAPTRERTSFSMWVALAVVIVLAFGLGVATERWPLAVNERPLIVREAPNNRPPRNIQDSKNDSLTLVVDGENGQPRQLDIPIADDIQAGSQWFQRDESREEQVFLREQLRQSGRRVTARDRFWVPVETHDGERYVVPIEQWRLGPVSHQQFQ